VCEPLPASAYGVTQEDVRVAAPGETPAGTVFEAVATKEGVETTARTRPWQGDVSSITTPTLQGDAAVGKTVTAAPGAWVGGWPPPATSVISSQPQTLACTEPTGGECWWIATGTVVLEPRWVGWYLFAREIVWPGDARCSFVPCPVSVIAKPVLPARADLAPGPLVGLSAPLGPIAGPQPPWVLQGCVCLSPPAPKASIRARALRSKGRLHVGRVSCAARCSVQLKVSGGKRRAVYLRFTMTGAEALTVPVRHGKLNVRVRVNGKLVTSRPTLAR
jgi:hypothetical protein